MAWDPRSTRRRQSSAASKQPVLAQNPSVTSTTIKPKSAHVADPSLQSFLNPSFDPADYLNAALPSLQTSSSRGGVPLAELSTQTQTTLSQLSAHTTRLTTTLTQLTDEILRSGSRLAYEVEILRGETLGLSEALTEGLQDDVAKFVANGLDQDLVRKQSRGETNGTRRRSSTITAPKVPIRQDSHMDDPPYIVKLRTLTLVRERLDTVIKTFGEAMAWTFPPSEISVTSSFLSVSAPEPGSQMYSTEEKGQEVSRNLRDQIADLLIGADPIEGIEAAAKRVEELKDLATVWKGTAEEKGRAKFVDNLAKLVEERHRDLLREAEQDGRLRQRVDTLHEEDSFGVEEDKPQSGYGFLSRLQKLRGAS